MRAGLDQRGQGLPTPSAILSSRRCTRLHGDDALRAMGASRDHPRLRHAQLPCTTSVQWNQLSNIAACWEAYSVVGTPSSVPVAVPTRTF